MFNKDRTVVWAELVQETLEDMGCPFSSVEVCKSRLKAHFKGELGLEITARQVASFIGKQTALTFSMNPHVELQLDLPDNLPLLGNLLRYTQGGDSKQHLLHEVFNGEECLLNLYLLVSTTHMPYTHGDKMLAWMLSIEETKSLFKS